MLEIARSVGLDQLQLHGDESPAMVARLGRALPCHQGAAREENLSSGAGWRASRRASALLLDGFDPQARGRNRQDVRLALARRAKRHGRIFLAGGLTPENVGQAIRAAQPYAVDVCSGVEAKPGKKDREAAESFHARGGRARREGSDEFDGASGAGRARAIRPVRRPLRSRNADGAARRTRARLCRSAGPIRLSGSSWTSCCTILPGGPRRCNLPRG